MIEGSEAGILDWGRGPALTFDVRDEPGLNHTFDLLIPLAFTGYLD